MKDKKRKIKVFFKDGKEDIIPQKFWDDYEYNYGLFVVKKKGEWIAVYNMDCVACVVVGWRGKKNEETDITDDHVDDPAAGKRKKPVEHGTL